MACIKNEELLEQYVDGELDPSMTTQVQHAVDACEHCRTFVQDMTLVRSALQTSNEDAVNAAPLDQLWSRIERRIDADETATSTSSESAAGIGDTLRRWWANQRLELSMGFAATAAAVAIGIWVLSAPIHDGTVATGVSVAKLESNNTLVVESYEVNQGIVVIDNEPGNNIPAVVWHFVDEEEEGS